MIPYFILGREHPIEQLPCRASVILGYFLYRVTNMDHHIVAGTNFFVLKKKETDGAFDTLCFAARHEAVAFDDPHWYPKAHSYLPQ